jgi:multicomponent Na+:H+ antiporter subunit D
MKILIVLPILIPLLTAAFTLCLYRAHTWQRVIGVAGMAAQFGAAVGLLVWISNVGIQSVQPGNWSAPFGITLVADLLSATLVVLAAGLGLLVAIYSLADIDARRQSFGYFPLLHVVIMGICGAFLTGDIFNLYVFFEVMLIASFVLVALGGERQQLEGALKYVILNLFSSAIFLAGVGILHGAAHTLNMADLHTRLLIVANTHPDLLATVQALFLIAFGVKAALFPLFFWLPASYATPPAAVSAIFAGLLTKVGVYSLFRVFTVVFPTPDWLIDLVLIIAGFTMLIGVIGAVAQMEFRRVLSFHSISQIGYMVMGIGLIGTTDPQVRTLAIAAALVYMVHHSIVKSNLFLISGVVKSLRGTYWLKPLGGMALVTPWLAGLFLVTALSLAGVPPLSGFWAKLAIIQAGFGAGQYVLTAVALLTGLLTLISMIKIWNEVFWKEQPEAEPGAIKPASKPPTGLSLRFAPIVVLAVATAGLGIFPSLLVNLAHKAAAQALDVPAYVQAVSPQEKLTIATKDEPEFAGLPERSEGNMP